MLRAFLHAAQPLFVPAFAVWGSPVTWLEIVAFVLALAMVFANFRVNPVGWPLAIISSLLYALLFVDNRLYGEASLQLIFVTLAFWGWWQWLRGKAGDGTKLHVRTMARRTRAIALAGTLAGWPLLGLLLRHATNSDVPWLDALPTVGSITGQILLGRKWVENWAVWMVVNVFSTGLFAYKGLWLTVLLYALFAILSWVGWRAWKRLAAAQA